MRQVIWNLMRNAVQASSAGDEVLVRVRDEGAGRLLEVADRGPGILAEARPRLFDAFFTTRSHGMGIGLAVVKRILDDHGFVIDVQSEQGNGTTFRVTVPAASTLEAEEAPPSSMPVSAPGRSPA
jgi:signal transduction histidine kinase